MDRITRFSGVFPILFFLIASTLLAWFSLDTYQRFSLHQVNLAKQSTNNAADNISHNIKVLRREIALFAAQKEALIKQVAENPNDKRLFNQLSNQLVAYFPNYYAFTVADTKGIPQLKFSQAKISTSCRRDLVNFSQNVTAPNLYVHQFIKPEILHFDLMTRIKIKGETVPFFVSFHMNSLARVLGGSSIAGHQLLLLEKNPKNLKIKAFSIYNENEEVQLRLTSPPNEESDVLAQTRIKGSNWLVVDIPNKNLYSTELTALITKAIAMTLLFFLVSLLFYYLLQREILQFDRAGRVITGVEKDRHRIAMDMHDQVLSDLSYLSRQCGFMQQSVHQPEKMHGHLTDSANALETVGNSIRTIIDDLHPQSLDILGLDESLRAYFISHFHDTDNESIDNIDIIFSTKDYQDKLLNDSQRLNLYRIVLEVIHNIVRHSEAQHCQILLSMSSSDLSLIIEDDGNVFRPKNREFRQQSDHIGGLANIKTRARMIHSAINWEAPRYYKQGSRFALTMPVTHHD